MPKSSFVNFAVFVLCSLIHCSYNIDNFDIEYLAASCPERDKCAGYRFDKNYTERSCECDPLCIEYNDCCVDYRRKSQNSQVQSYVPRMVCMNIGEDKHRGIYVVASCRDGWRDQEVREKCEGPDDFRNPLLSAPVFRINRATAFKNRYCAQCNRAVEDALKVFQIKLYCEGHQNTSDEEILAGLNYNIGRKSWGFKKLNNKNQLRFHSCNISFDVPPSLNTKVRFCRANLVDSCNPAWRGGSVMKRCAQYMAVVYDGSLAYRNPHCAFCNFKSVNEIQCKRDHFIRNQTISPVLLLGKNEESGIRDVIRIIRCRRIYSKRCINRIRRPHPLPSDEYYEEFITSYCNPKQTYDTFSRKCRNVTCIPGNVLVRGECVRS